MMVIFVSQCEKNALKKTRRVLDAFADRIGDNTWQTIITQEGLLAVKKLLRKTASKSTAVSCHWIRSRARSELLWVVGKRDKFDEVGRVAVNSTKRDLLNSEIENDWCYLPLIKALVALSALLHDWGKATALFQKKLHPRKGSNFKGDPIRHEWISILLLNAFVQSTDTNSDEAWLSKLSVGELDEEFLKLQIQKTVSKPLSDLPPLAKLVAWLIVSHHRLPLPGKERFDDYKSEAAKTLDIVLARITKEWGYENRYDEAEYQKRLKDCFTFPKGLISNSKPWLNQVKKWSQRLLACQNEAQQSIADGSYRLILNHARLSLMLGDHYYSSQQADQKWQDATGLYANTDRQSGELKQKLDEHLVGVARHALQTAHLLPAFEKELPSAEDIDSLRRRSPEAFKWQDKSVEKINAWLKENDKETKQDFGFFTVNMASTGCGKTFANAKVMRALSHDAKSLRFILALGLRTLTLQTGDEYRERVGLDNSELAVLIGSRAVMELHEQSKADKEEQSFENTGSMSQEALLDEEIDFECAIPEQGFTTVLTCDRDKQFLYAPVLACTIDHLMAATETKRGGRYILPTLRLMSSDLVIDEIDDFTGNDLIAIGRLIHLAGMLGRKVMISSATIPPYLAEGFFKAYQDGWLIYCKTRSAKKMIGCAWIDEFSTDVSSVSADEKASNAVVPYRQYHEKFIEKRVAKLKLQPAKRKADIASCQSIIDNHKVQSHQQQEVIGSKQNAYFNVIAQSVLTKHKDHHFIDPLTQLNVSFGVVRVANIAPCIELTKFLLEKDWPQETEARVMAYHSQQVLLLRSVQEKHLDQVLKRKEKAGEMPEALSNPVIRSHLDAINKNSQSIRNVVFILVATPVEEVGRDHDFDWAVVEPSSYRSIIQLAGRVKRHRSGEVEKPNVSLLQYNWKGIRDSHLDKVVFNRPGFEELIRLTSHDLSQLVDEKALSQRLDAIPRIQLPVHLKAEYLRKLYKASNLAELEHAATWNWLANYKSSGEGAQTGPQTLRGWLNQNWFLTALPQALSPFRQSEPTLKVFLVFDEEIQQNRFCEKNDQGYPVDREDILNIKRIELSPEAKSRLWLMRSFDQSCIELADQQERSLRSVSIRYGELSFPHDEKKQYGYNDQLGLVKL
jgi:CRISPR-associated endonuclease/helicase Cas3